MIYVSVHPDTFRGPNSVSGCTATIHGAARVPRRWACCPDGAAALLLPPGGAISHASAAYLHGADVLTLDPPVDLSIPVGRVMTPRPGLRVRRTRLDDDIVVRALMPVTTPARTAFDLARRLDPVEAVVGLDALLKCGAVDLKSVRSYLAERADWPGARRATEALDLARPLVESPMETRLRLILVSAGFPCPAIQHRVGRYRLDLAYPALKLAIEYDGDHHRERGQFRADVARLNALRAAGWTVLRFTADDMNHPDRVVAQVGAVVRGIR